MSDDHAAHAISADGGRLAEVAPTPNMDRLAKEGALFANALVLVVSAIMRDCGFVVKTTRVTKSWQFAKHWSS